MVEGYRQKVLWLTPLQGGSVIRGMESEESQFKRTLGATILALRVGAGIRSQAALAVRLVESGVESLSEATVRRWEQGTSAPDAWEVQPVVRALWRRARSASQPGARDRPRA